MISLACIHDSSHSRDAWKFSPEGTSHSDRGMDLDVAKKKPQILRGWKHLAGKKARCSVAKLVPHKTFNLEAHEAFLNLQFPSWGKTGPTVASGSCSWLTTVEPDEDSFRYTSGSYQDLSNFWFCIYVCVYTVLRVWLRGPPWMWWPSYEILHCRICT